MRIGWPRTTAGAVGCGGDMFRRGKHVAELLRNEKKWRLHKPGCRAAVGPYVKPWVWAQDKSMDEVREALGTILIGFTECKVCRPMEVSS